MHLSCDCLIKFESDILFFMLTYVHSHVAAVSLLVPIRHQFMSFKPCKDSSFLIDNPQYCSESTQTFTPSVFRCEILSTAMHYSVPGK